MRAIRDAVSYILLSIIGASLIIILIWLDSSQVPVSHSDKLIVGGVFVTSCLFGISLALRPGWIGRLLRIRKRIHGSNSESLNDAQRVRKGHHPDCEHFKGHTILRGRRVLCAGCLGLSLGSLFAILVTVLYIFIPYDWPFLILYIITGLGFLYIALSYAEILLPARNATVHVVTNVLLVVGFFFVTIGVLELTNSMVYGILTVIISFLWLDTRIQLSNWRHTITCRNCAEKCKIYLD